MTPAASRMREVGPLRYVRSGALAVSPRSKSAASCANQKWRAGGRAGVFVVGERTIGKKNADEKKADEKNADDDAIMRFEITIENIPA
jgi:hypothetical protein